MKSTEQTLSSFACDDLPLPVIIHRQSDGRVIKYNKEARRVFDLPLKATRSINIHKLQLEKLSASTTSTSRGYSNFGPIPHRTLKGKEILLIVLRKAMRWQEEDCYADFFEDSSEVISVKNEIISSSLDAFVSMDEDQTILDWNSSAEKIFGWKKKEVVGLKLAAVIIPEHYRQRHSKGFKHYLKTGEGSMLNRLIEITALHKKGHEFPIELTVSPSKENGKKIFYSFIRDISDRKNFTMNLQESEEKLKKAQAIASIGSWEMFGNFNELAWSDEFYRIHGLEPQSVKPSTRLRISMVHPMDRPKLENAIKEAMHSGKPFSFEKRIILPDGSIRWVNSRGEATLDSSGKRKVFGTVLDITERKQIEEKQKHLIQLLADFQQAIQSSSIVSRADKFGTITYVNGNFVNISGYKEAELIGKNHRIINSGFHPKSFWVAMWKTISVGKPWRADVKNKSKDGSYYWVDTFVMPFLDDEGNVREFLSIRNEITDRKVQEQNIVRLNYALSDFQNAIQNSSIVSRADKSGIITYVNENFIEISGYAETELLGQNHRIINSGHHSKLFWTGMWKTIASGKVWRAEVKNKARDGSYYWVDTFVMPFLDENGKVKEFLSIRNDITARKESEEQVAASNARLSETLIFGKMGSAELNTKTFQLTVSKELFQLLEVHVSEPQTLPIQKFLETYVNPIYLEVIQKKIREGMEGLRDFKKTVELEFEMITTSGRKIWIEAKGIFKGDTALVILHDVTDKKEAEKKIVREKELSDSIVNGLPGTFFLFDQQQKFLRWNKNFETVTGYSADEISQMTPFNFFDDHALVADRMQRVFTHGLADAEINLLTKNQTMIPYFFNGWLKDYEGKPCIIGIGMDYSQRKKAEQEALQKTRMIEVMMGGITDGFFAMDRNLNFVMISPVFAALADNSPDEMIGRHILEVFPNMEDNELFEKYKNAIITGEAFSAETEDTISQQIFEVNAYPNTDGIFIYFKDISRVKKTEAALAQSWQSYRNIFEANPLPMWILDTETHAFLEVNDTAVVTYGYSKEEFFGMTIQDIKRLEDATELINVLQRNKDDYLRIGQTKHKLKDNSIIDVEIYSHSIFYKDKNCRFIVSIDITDRKQAEVELRKSEERYRQLYNNTPAMMHSVDSSGKLIRVSDFWLQKMEYSREEVLSKPAIDFLTDGSRQEAIQHIIPAFMKSGRLINQEFHYVTKSGKVLETLISTTSEKNNAGELIHAMSVITDITAKNQLAKENSKLAMIASHTSNAVVFTDLERKIIWVNEGFERITEYSRHELIGRKPGDFLQGPNTDLETIKLMSNALNKGEGFKVELLNYSKSGKQYWLDIEVMPVKNEMGKLTGFMAIQSDITNLKNAIHEMQRSERTLHAFMDHAPMVAFVKDTEGRYTFYNKMYHDFMGNELKVGNTDYDIFDKEFSDLCVKRDQHIIATGETLQFEHAVKNQTFLEYKFPLRDAYQKIFAVGGISLDITEKIEAQKLIADREEQLRSLADNLPNGVVYRYLVNQHGNIGSFPFVSSGSTSVLDYTPEEIRENPMVLFEQMDQKMIPVMLAAAEVSRNTLTNFELEYRITTKSGMVKWVHTRSKPKRLSNGFTEWSGLTVDITDRKTMQIELEKVYDELNAMLNSTSEATFLLDREYKIQVYNRVAAEAIQKIYGKVIQKGDNIIGYSAQSMINDFKLNFAKAINGESLTIEKEIEYNESIKIWWEVRYFPVKNSAGSVIGVAFSSIDITKRKLSQENLRQTQLRLQAIFDNAINAIILADDQGNYLDGNEAAYKMLGYTRDELRHLHVAQVVLPETMKADPFNKFLKEGQQTGVIDLRTKEGKIRTVRYSAVANILENLHVSILEDITDKKQAEKSLQFTRFTIDHTSDPIFWIRPDASIADINPAAHKSLGYSFEEMIVLRIPDVDSNYTAEVWPTHWSELRERKSMNFETQQIRKDGTLVDVEVNANFIEFEGEEYNCAFVRDITDRKRASQKLMESEQRFNSFMRHTPVSNWITDAMGRMKYINDAYCKMFDCDQENVLEKNVFDIYPPEVAQQFLDNIQAVAKSGEALQTIEIAPRPDKSLGEFLVYKFPMEGDIVGGVAVDISIQRSIERELIKSIKEKETLIKEIHHRVKNNLQLISSILYIRMKSMVEQTEMKAFLEDTRLKIKSIALIHERLLQTGSINEVDISDYLHKLIKDLHMSSVRQDLHIVIEAQIEPERMNSDTAIYCGLVINELVTNSIKHAFTNRAEGKVEISLAKVNERHRLKVSDNGTSLSENVSIGKSGSFGMQMLEVFIQQLGGTWEINRKNGTCFIIDFN